MTTKPLLSVGPQLPSLKEMAIKNRAYNFVAMRYLIAADYNLELVVYCLNTKMTMDLSPVGSTYVVLVA